MADLLEKNKYAESKKKIPFNKKKWREQKYSTKARVQKWEEGRRKSTLRKYNKLLKKEGLGNNARSTGEPTDKKNLLSAVKLAQLKYQNEQEEKRKAKNEQERKKKEMQEALQVYREKKAAKFRKLSQKTKKGQPVMKGRIELLLEKIQSNYMPERK